MTILFTATTASPESQFMFMKRNCFTKPRLVFMPAQICSVASRGTRWIRRTRSLRIVMPCLGSELDFDGPTDSQFFWIAKPNEPALRFLYRCDRGRAHGTES